MSDSTPIVWSPPRTGRTRIEELMALCGTDDYMELHSRSVGDPAWFWTTVASELEFPFPVPFEDAMDASGGVEWTRWFVGGRTNVALAALRHAEEGADETACIGLAEDGEPVLLSFAELASRVGGTQRELDRNGVGEGDRVGLFSPMCVDALIAYLAIIAQGAIVVPLFSGFAASAIRARLADAGAELLMAPRSTVRGGREIDMFSIAADAVAGISGVDVLDLGESTAGVDSFDPRLVECESPFLLGYTSGTTAKPKGALLSHGGAGLKIASEGAFNFDMCPGDRHLWVTDIGWIMGTWSILAALCNGAAVVLMEGLPVEPPDRLWKACEQHEITHLGVSPTLARGLMDKPGEIPELPRLRGIGSTGEPLDEKAWNWLFHDVGRGRTPILNISGGTEVGAALLGPTPITPMKAGTVGMPALGLDIQVMDEAGSALGPGEVGELCCRNAWPGMTRGLWRDPERYIDAYWSRHPHVWTHGDWASFDEDGLWFLHGRSDDTINIAGKRIGPAEIEAVILAEPEVESAAVIGMPHPVKGEAIWVFAVGDGDQEIETRLRTSVADALGASFRPERVVMVDDIPRTRSQKLARRVVRSVALGEETGDTSGLDNPEAAEVIRKTLERTG
ncbi:MAG: AMP-binding protein [Solirubrobacterales bacterium]